MAYTEVSEHEYITGDELEAFTSVDYSIVNATAFTEANVMATVTIAEQIINSYMGTSDALTISDGVKMSTMLISAKLLNNNMQNLGYGSETIIPLINLSIPEILKMFLHETQDDFVESIPMSGASYYKPDARVNRL